jgi:hypothetical protein
VGLTSLWSPHRETIHLLCPISYYSVQDTVATVIFTLGTPLESFHSRLRIQGKQCVLRKVILRPCKSTVECAPKHPTFLFCSKRIRELHTCKPH